MKILFITGAYPRGIEGCLSDLSKGSPLSIPSNAFQWAVIDGLERNGADYQVVSYPFLSCFPLHFKRLYSPRADFIINGRLIGSMQPYLNVSLIANTSIKYRLFHFVEKWIKRNKSEDILYALVYSPYSRYISPLIQLKRKYSNLKICSIITDLPEDYIYHKERFSKYFKSKWDRETKTVKNLMSGIDKFVLIAQKMEEKIPESVGNNIVIEGIYSELDEGVDVIKGKNETKTLLYSGSLGNHACIKDLVDAFLLTKNKKYRLVICGCGENAGYIQEKSLVDSRIIFKGMLPRADVLELQRKATVVINPRNSSVPLTRYSFPSKTMEYMASGTPFIGYKLDGIPMEYYNCFYTVETESIHALSAKISEVLEKPQNELDEMATKARSFILNHKTSKVQVARLLDFLKN